MNAYLIDPTTRSISQVETDFSLSSICGLLGCSLISSAAGQPNGDMMFVDDNVSDDEHDAIQFGTWKVYSKALVVGTDRSGETVSPKVRLSGTKRRSVGWERRYLNPTLRSCLFRKVHG